MGIFRKQTIRAPLTTALLILLLALSIAASSIGFAAWTEAKKHAGLIENEYTTIAVPRGQNFEKKSEVGGYWIEEGNFIFEDGTKYIDPAASEITAKESEYYLSSDNRILLSAHIPDSTTLSSGTIDPLRYNNTLDQYCYQFAVMALRCIHVQETDTYRAMGYASYYAEFEVVDDVCRIEAYDLPPYEDTLVMESMLFTPNGSVPFEVGKTYLVRGRYWDYDVYGKISGIGEPTRKRDTSGVFQRRSLLMDPEYPLANSADYPNFRVAEMKIADSNLKYRYTPEDCLPYYVQYDGEWEKFLESKDGQVWKNEVIPYVEQNHESVPVILTDNIESMYFFNTGEASILDGKLFEDADYQKGNAVCLLSATYAHINDLSVGDTVHLDFHHTGYEQTDYPVLQGTGRDGITIVRYPLSESNRIGVEKDYTIIGIYTAPEWEAGSQSFHADTVFVPKTSVPNASNYTGPSVTLLNTIILKNGSVEAFETHMAANDKAGAYIYFDQGYTEAAASVRTMIDNSMRLMLVGIAMFVLASLLFLLLFAHRVSAVTRSMRLLGVPKKQTWLECLGTLFMQELTAVLLGNALAVVLYDRITARLLSGTPVLSMESVLISVGVQLAVLLLIGGVWMHMIAGRNLMQRDKAVFTIRKKHPEPTGA